MSWKKGFDRHLENVMALMDFLKVLLDWLTMTLGFAFLSAIETDLEVHMPGIEVIIVSLIFTIVVELIYDIDTVLPKFFTIICFLWWLGLVFVSLFH